MIYVLYSTTLSKGERKKMENEFIPIFYLNIIKHSIK